MNDGSFRCLLTAVTRGVKAARRAGAAKRGDRWRGLSPVGERALASRQNHVRPRGTRGAPGAAEVCYPREIMTMRLAFALCALLPACGSVANDPDPACGDGTVDDGEVCDDGNNQAGDGCSEDCGSDETCGNGYVDSIVGEVCDDGNVNDGDGCSGDCRINALCGNGDVDIG